MQKRDSHIVHRNSCGSFAIWLSVVGMSVHYQIGLMTIDDFR